MNTLKQKNKKIVFFGTPALTVPILNALKNAGYAPSLIVTAPDAKIGRHQTLTPPPAKVWAIENNIAFIQPEKLTKKELEFALEGICGGRRAEQKEFFSKKISVPREGNSNSFLFTVVAYGQIIPQEIIDLPKFGTINIHYSLLPRWRGASPVESAILAGDTETGVSIQKMVFKLDAGAVLAETKTPIGETETTPELRDKLNTLAQPLLIETIEKIFAGITNAIEQDETKVTLCKKTKKEDGLVDLENDSPVLLWRKYRAYFGWPGIFFIDKNNKRVKITNAEFSEGKFCVQKVIPESKKEMDYKTFLKTQI